MVNLALKIIRLTQVAVSKVLQETLVLTYYQVQDLRPLAAIRPAVNVTLDYTLFSPANELS